LLLEIFQVQDQQSIVMGQVLVQAEEKIVKLQVKQDREMGRAATDSVSCTT